MACSATMDGFASNQIVGKDLFDEVWNADVTLVECNAFRKRKENYSKRKDKIEKQSSCLFLDAFLNLNMPALACGPCAAEIFV